MVYSHPSEVNERPNHGSRRRIPLPGTPPPAVPHRPPTAPRGRPRPGPSRGRGEPPPRRPRSTPQRRRGLPPVVTCLGSGGAPPVATGTDPLLQLRWLTKKKDRPRRSLFTSLTDLCSLVALMVVRQAIGLA